MPNDFRKRLENTLESNYANSPFGAGELAREMGMSRSNLLRKVRSLTGKSISQLINEYRLTKAREILQSGDISITEAALKSGFSTPAYFATSFKKHFGHSPGETISKQSDNPPVESQNFASHNGNQPHQSKNTRPRNGIIAGSLFILISAGIFIFLIASGRIVKNNSIAVMPLRSNSRTAAEAAQTEMIREQVITTLSQVRVFDIKSATASNLYTDTVGNSIQQISRKLKVKYILEGSVSIGNDSANLHLQFIRGRTDNHLWAQDYYFPVSGNEKNVKMLEIAEHVSYELNTEIKPDEASAILVRCTQSDESLINYLKGYSLIYSGSGVYPEKALLFFREAVRADSTWPSPYLGISDALAAIARLEPREEYYRERLNAVQKAHEIKPGPWSYQSLARYYLDAGETRKAKKYYKKGIRKYPDYINLNILLARVSEKQGKWKEVEKRYLKVNNLDPNYAALYESVGRTYELMRDFPNSIKYLKKGISVNPGYSIFYFDLAKISLKWNGDPDEARDIILEAIEYFSGKESDKVRAYYILTLSDIFQGKYEEALKKLSQWTVVPGNHPPPYYYHPKYYYYAQIYGYLNEPVLERRYYDSTRLFIEGELARIPLLWKRPALVSCLGMAYAGLGESQEACDRIDKVKTLLKKKPDAFMGPFAMEDVAWTYAKLGNYDQALKTIRGLLSKPGPLTAKLLEIDPKWSALKGKPGFQELVQEYSVEVKEITGDTSEIYASRTTGPEIAGPSFTDERDGNVYHYCTIGTQNWMAENLAFLPSVSPPDTGSHTKKHYYVWGYEGNDVSDAKMSRNYSAYGVLYNWEAAISACPEGWHLPSDDEWKTLERHLGINDSDIDLTGWRESGSVGKQLKLSSGWSKEGNGTNSAGFYALPGGGRWWQGKRFYNLGSCADFWSSTELDNLSAMFRDLDSENDGVYRFHFDKRNGFSIRCIRN